MCFSAQASFIAAGCLSLIGLLSLRTMSYKSYWALAASPFFFAIQQALEGIVWVTLNNTDATSMIHNVGVYGFNFFAGMFWPVWIPFALALAETNSKRKNILIGMLIAGSLVGMLSLYGMVQLGVVAHATHNHITYDLVSNPHSESTTYAVSTLAWAIYLAVTAGACFVSSINYMWVVGIFIAAAFAIARIFFALSFGSVWCFLAAIISAMLLLVFKLNKNH